MANTFKFGNGKWATKKDTVLAYNDENENFKPLPFTFSRASNATVVNQNGLIETVGSGEPRIDFSNDAKGALLLEPSRTNLLPYSTLAFNGDVKPTGWTVGFATGTYSHEEVTYKGQGAIKHTQITNGRSYLDSGSLTLVNGTTYTLTVKFDLENCSVATLSEPVLATNGFSVNTSKTFSDIDENGVLSFQFTTGVDSVGNIRIGLGNQGDAAGGQFLTFSMPQLEAGSYSTSFIPTQGSAVTRAIDSCVQYNLPTSVINSAYPFSIYVKAQPIVDGNNKTIISFLNTASSNQYYDVLLYSNGQIHLEARANGSTESLYSGQSVSTGDTVKVCMVMESATSGKICVNGQSVQSKTNFANQAVNSSINSLIAGQLRTNGDTLQRVTVNEIQLYNTALTDAELQALTTL